MTGFDQCHYQVNGVDTVVLTAGSGDPVVFFHGAGSGAGFDALLPIARERRLIVPWHPGFGPSADDPGVDEIHDYRRHYLDLFDLLGIARTTLIGHSMGGYLAASFAVDHPERVDRLILGSPIGLKVPEHPTVDLFTIPPADLLAQLTERPSIFDGIVPDPPTPEFLADQYRELTSAARLLWERPYDRKLERWLHRITMPTLLLWGEADRMVPVGQCATWSRLLPNAEEKVLPGVGHLLFDESAEAVLLAAGFATAPKSR